MDYKNSKLPENPNQRFVGVNSMGDIGDIAQRLESQGADPTALDDEELRAAIQKLGCQMREYSIVKHGTVTSPQKPPEGTERHPKWNDLLEISNQVINGQREEVGKLLQIAQEIRNSAIEG